MVLSDVIRIGTFASQPAANAVPTGTLYYITDFGILQRSNGTTWDSYSLAGSGLQYPSPGFIRRDNFIRETRFVPQPAASGGGGGTQLGIGLVSLVTPVDANYSWVNQGSASVNATSGKCIYLSTPAASGVNIKMREVAAPATPYTLTVAMIPDLVGISACSMGIYWRDSVSGKIVAFGLGSPGTSYDVRVNKFTNATTFSANYTSFSYQMVGPYIWLRISDDGTNRTCYSSFDGINFRQIHQVSRTDFLTATNVGYYVDAEQTSQPIGTTLISWSF